MSMIKQDFNKLKTIINNQGNMKIARLTPQAFEVFQLTQVRQLFSKNGDLVPN